MLVFRRVILPIAWLLVFAVIGVALIKLAFFPASEETAELGSGEVPTGEITDPQISAWRDTIRNDLELAATVQNDPAVDVTVNKPGNVIDVFSAVGDTVAAGDVIASVREDIPTDDGGTYPVWSEVVAPASGTISASTLVSGAAVAPGDKVGAIAPSTFRVQGTIAPADRYRLTTEPTEASIQITNGPAPFTCTGLVLETPLPGSDDGETGATGEVTTTVRCPVPPDVRVFPGLAATMTIAGGLAEDVLVLPITAVLGSSGEGTVFVPGPDGLPEERAVTLGLADAEKIEIVDGLEEGEMVYEYVPTSVVAGGETGL
ncbi:HlyD family efflux transporter periplasmic adaptor subunit [Microbacterium sediminis]|uniref:CzcB-like C-terminal circularly permuted SH3-like domain-containing protein n=1 Tax=Microbacterium sediminis TaxID=904291 RepID=A0A1B9NGJ3_9MICO|nr:HlyD family efflux transporter periplasmic adaptor subunit [Microbacterium sediminis]OCG75690.1 hypothetical protein A7J15_01160 [Microbacterium sediminis]QBR74086.1 hypothetical protein E3O41_06415 [Microbacterium sediminis]